MSHDALLIVSALGAIAVLVFLIAKGKVHPVLALTLVAVAFGGVSGMKLTAVITAFQEGIGATLGPLSIVVGLGLMLGKLLAESGGAQVVAFRFIQMMGEKRLPLAMMLVALIVGVPVLFTVGLVLLVPVIYAIARETKSPLLRIALPAMAGLSVAQGLLPPHPGPMLAITNIGADVGKTILYGFIVGLPTAVVAGPVLAYFLGNRVQVVAGELTAAPPVHPARLSTPGFGLTLVTILLPILLMLQATAAELLLPKDNPWRTGLDFVGSPLVAMLLAVLLALWSFGFARGFSAPQVLGLLEQSLAPAGGILLIVGAGGGLSRVLRESGLGDIIGAQVKQAHVSPILLGWLVAAAVRLAVGSATVAIILASAILKPVVGLDPTINRELLVLAMGAGSLFCSHVNDSGFWFVKENFKLTVPQTFKTWTILETSIGLVGLLLTLLLSRFV